VVRNSIRFALLMGGVITLDAYGVIKMSFYIHVCVCCECIS
jgi:hypothetical protein